MLDVATGTGALPAALAARDSSPRRLIGIDSSPEMLALAPRLPADWELAVADGTELPFDDGSFDVVTASYLLHVCEPEQRERLMREIARVLRDGGRLGLITVAPPRSRATAALLAPIVRAARNSSGRFAGMRPFDPAELLGEHGFSELARAVSLRGYPSLCVVAAKPRGSAPHH